MIDIRTYATGSTGNLYTIENNHKRLMIEAGLPVSEIKKHLDFNFENISGCLISHSHKDHCMAAKDVMKLGVDCYMSQETADSMKLSGHRLKVIEPLKQFKINDFTVLPFETEHDCEGCLGFLIHAGENKVLFITDSYYCKYQFKGLTHILIEVNFCIDILNDNIKRMVTPMEIKKRLLNSHFSLCMVIDFFKANDLSKLKEVHLIHISETNGDKMKFKQEIQKLTGVPVYV
jgi:phosphoribosyl 1,2-cyclic phosphodiesterase